MGEGEGELLVTNGIELIEIVSAAFRAESGGNNARSALAVWRSVFCLDDATHVSDFDLHRLVLHAVGDLPRVVVRQLPKRSKSAEDLLWQIHLQMQTVLVANQGSVHSAQRFVKLFEAEERAIAILGESLNHATVAVSQLHELAELIDKIQNAAAESLDEDLLPVFLNCFSELKACTALSAHLGGVVGIDWAAAHAVGASTSLLTRDPALFEKAKDVTNFFTLLLTAASELSLFDGPYVGIAALTAGGAAALDLGKKTLGQGP